MDLIAGILIGGASRRMGRPKALIEIADRYPLALRTEKDFFPLIETYLHGRVPLLEAEADRSGGRVDFRIGGNNPSLLEVALAPRALSDPNDGSVQFPGNKG